MQDRLLLLSLCVPVDIMMRSCGYWPKCQLKSQPPFPGEASFRAAVQETPTAKDSLNDVDQEMPSVELPSSSAAV